MSSNTQGRGGRGGGRESSQGRGGRGYTTHSNWRPVRGRGSSSVPQQQPATPAAGGREAIPKLVVPKRLSNVLRLETYIKF
jgi:hypothetical protein